MDEEFEAESPFWWRVRRERDGDRVTVELAMETALAVAKRDDFHRKPGASRAVRDLLHCIGEAVP